MIGSLVRLGFRVALLLLAAAALVTGKELVLLSQDAAVDGLGPGRSADTVVVAVVDGDTIVVRGGIHVRLIGVDTPETKDPRRPVGCLGEEAARHTTRLLPPGTSVRLVGDLEPKDRYARVLAYAYRRADGLFVNAELVRQGYARPLTIPPNLAHAPESTALAAEARAAHRGLWSSCPS